jgi:lysophospholipase L1-like esterase
MKQLLLAIFAVSFSSALHAAEPLAPKADGTPLRLACVGDSITQGSGAGKGNFGINDTALQEQMPVYAKLAEELKVDVIDMYAALDGKPELLPDRVHPNAAGAGEMAKAAAKALTGKDH